ncbi:MAG: protease complex subunit PrcB family protein [Planctomycetes bacterium]|nr:protease complex subunit PrcB family protein [Planctomycetota bacterium]
MKTIVQSGARLARLARLAPLPPLAMSLAVVLAGCGGGKSSAPRASTAGAVSPPTSGTTTTTTPLTGAHGELVAVPALTGGDALALLVDGAPAPLEVVDPAPLLAAGLHEGFTLVVTGEVVSNFAGRSALADAVRVTTFQADDVVTGGRLRAGVASVAFADVRGAWHDPVGPLAAGLLASPLERPLFVTGRLDPSGLVVTSWRPAVSISWSTTLPLLGFESFAVDDLEGTGAYRGESTYLNRLGPETTRGAGRRLPAGVLADLRGRVAAANLRALPSTFQPPQVYPDHPTQTVTFADDQGEHSITVWSGATVPPALEALMQALAALRIAVPSYRDVERGDQSQIDQPTVEAARDAGAWAGLWGRHVGGRPLPPQVDFTHEVALGVFDGMRPTGGYEVEVVDLEQIGPHLHLRLRRAVPTGAATTVITAPYHVVAVSFVGAASGAELWVEGARVP